MVQLGAARKARAAGQWQQVYDLAAAVLNTNSSDAEAQKLKDEAANKRFAALFYAGKYAEAWILSADVISRTAETEMLLGLFYVHGFDQCQIDLKVAFEHFQTSARMGDPIGKSQAAWCLRNGIGCLKQADEADRIDEENFGNLFKLAESGNSLVQFILGRSYADGLGVAKDPVEAVKWYRKSADQGNADAQFNLGVCYEKGLGVAKDLVEAVKWYRKSADQGNKNAERALRRLGKL